MMGDEAENKDGLAGSAKEIIAKADAMRKLEGSGQIDQVEGKMHDGICEIEDAFNDNK